MQRRFACNAQRGLRDGREHHRARSPARDAGDVVLLAAHYDSVGAGPGASDDGMGMATLLEIARAIRERALPQSA